MHFLDPDRLNDILFAQRIDQQIINLIANTLGNHSFFVGGEPLPIALIERTDRDWQWAKDWTKTTLELLKKLSLTFILTDGYLNGSAYGFDPEYTANLPNSLNLGAFPETVSVRVPRGQRVSVTYLERAHSVPSAPYCSQVVNKISCWMLRYREFSAPNSEDLVVEIDAREILFNSMVISQGGSLNKGANLLLYSKLTDTLNSIYNSLNISTCKVLIGMTVTDTCQVKVFPGRTIQYTDNTFNYETRVSCDNYAEFQDCFSFPTYSNPVFASVPSHYCNAGLYYPNGSNLGANIVIRKSPTISFSFIQGDNYARHAYDTPSGIPHKIFPQLESMDVARLDLEMLAIESADSQVAYVGGSVSSYKYFYGFGNNLTINLVPESDFNLSVNGFSSGDGIYTKATATDSYAVQGSTTVNTGLEIIPFTYNAEQENKQQSCVSYIKQYSLPPNADYNLFSSGDVAWVFNGFVSKLDVFQTIAGMFLHTVGSVGYFEYFGNLSIDTYLKGVTGGKKFTINAIDPYFLGVAFSPLSQTETIIHEQTIDTPFCTSQGYLPQFMPLFEEYKQNSFSFTLSRTFRAEPLPQIIIQF